MGRVRLTVAVVLIGLVVTAAAGLRVDRSRDAALEQRLLVDAVTYAGTIQSELERHVGAAYALRDLFDDGPRISRTRYERAIEALGLEQFPALQGLNIIRPVPAVASAAFTAEKRATGYPEYAIDDSAPPPADGERWLVSLVAPYGTNGALLGRDVRAIPGLEAAFARARDLGQPALGPVVGEHGTGAAPRVGLAVPVYALGERTDGVAQRREHLVGWVVTTVRSDGLVEGVTPQHELEIVVVDGTDGTAMTIGRSGVPDGDHRRAVEHAVDVYGRTWTVTVAPGPGYVAGTEGYALVVVVALGLLLTALVAGLVHVLVQRSSHERRLVEVRTRELADANQQLETVNRELELSVRELNRRTEVDRLVQAAAWQVSQARDLADALERLRTVIEDVAPFDRVGFSVRIDGRRMRVVAVAGAGQHAAPAGVEYQASERLWRSFTTHEMMVARDTTAAPEGTLEHALAARGIRGIVALPLVARGEVAGILTLGSSQPLDLPPADVQLLHHVAEGTAGSIVTLLALEAERSASEQLRQLDELKDEFLGVVAHDLKGPLSVLTGFTDLLLEQCDAGELDPDLTRGSLGAMHRAATNQERLISDLLESQRLALGVAVPMRAPVVLGDLVRETLADLASGTGAAVSFEDHAPGVHVSADREWIRRVVTNLTTNAWKYGSPAIDVRVTVGEGVVHVEVSDHGPGIAADDVPRLFQRFSRLGASDGLRPSGTGLGLYICKALVEAQDGRIGVHSTEGRGSTFWFELPSVHAPVVPA